VRAPVILAIETATEVCGAAIADREGVRAEALIRAGLSHSSRLIELVERVLADTASKLEDLDAIGVSAGPGSFTGIRIGMGVAIGIATGAGLPVVGVPTLDSLAWSQLPFEGLVCPFIDARRGEAYYCIYEASGDALKRKQDYAVSPPAKMVADVARSARESGASGACGESGACEGLLLAGPASLLAASGAMPAELDGAVMAAPERCYPSPGSLAIVASRLHAGGKSGDPDTLKPIYVRRSDAELRRS
jgi:tRNA threonylcarbamoyladenosine biosynthesis protein TsaB